MGHKLSKPFFSKITYVWPAYHRWVDTGRQLISALLCRSEKDPQNFAMAYDGLVEFLSEEANVAQMTEELASRNVKCCNFYDIVLDYILVDSFEDLESPPSSVLAVMKNRWLSDGFKESALHTAIWDVNEQKCLVREKCRYFSHVGSCSVRHCWTFC